MKIKTGTNILWTCPKCKRQFERKGQTHSCKSFPIEQHFLERENSKALYEKLRRAIKQRSGNLKIESLECCIHFVSTFTFAAVKIFKSKIRVDFALSSNIKSKRITRSVKMSANRYLCYVDITNENEIDDELLDLIQAAHEKK